MDYNSQCEITFFTKCHIRGMGKNVTLVPYAQNSDEKYMRNSIAYKYRTDSWERFCAMFLLLKSIINSLKNNSIFCHIWPKNIVVFSKLPIWGNNLFWELILQLICAGLRTTYIIPWGYIIILNYSNFFNYSRM